MSHSKDGSKIDQDLIRDLATLLKETELSEIEVEQDGLRVRVARQLAGVTQVAAAPIAAAAPVAGAATAPATNEADPSNHPGAVKSPMVGTIYVAPEPGARPFVRVGDTVSEGETVLIVEAMKTMNHIPAPKAGKVTQILVEDGQPIEFGEPLLIIE
ncbi:MAG: acetyl-CoA carboxylase biotin carboxyl carrier protein [Alphaproteobacteria bacterium]|nr:MAG: acetyl-CoA carboxylase biotin carboxyl carrier protein [Alphaproteobacteria bacterium]